MLYIYVFTRLKPLNHAVILYIQTQSNTKTVGMFAMRTHELRMYAENSFLPPNRKVVISRRCREWEEEARLTKKKFIHTKSVLIIFLKYVYGKYTRISFIITAHATKSIRRRRRRRQRQQRRPTMLTVEWQPPAEEGKKAPLNLCIKADIRWIGNNNNGLYVALLSTNSNSFVAISHLPKLSRFLI